MQKWLLMHNAIFLTSLLLFTSLSQSMSENKNIYEAWLERTISEVKGSRVIHFYLASTSESPLLAIVGIEKNDRHFSYEVCDNYLKVFGSSPAINAQTKWTSRSIVIDWLRSVVRKDDHPSQISNLHNVSTHEGDGSMNAIATSIPDWVQEPSGVQLPKPAPSHQGNGSLDVISEPTGAQIPEPAPVEQAPFKVGDYIEFLSKDENMHDFWYTCKILEMYKNFWKVQCNGRKFEEGSGNLEQEPCIPLPRLAPPDELSLRHTGRLTIRPCPPEEEAPTTFKVGAAVDARWEDGWYEGFVLTVESLSNSDSYHVFLPGPRRFLTLHRKDLRASRDWVDDTWVLIKPNPDILSFIRSHV